MKRSNTTPPPSQTIDTTQLMESIYEVASVAGPDGLQKYVLNIDMLDEIEQLIAADRATLKQSIQAKMPEKKEYVPPQDLTDHWGLTESSLQRTTDNMAAVGFNAAINQFNTILDSVLGGE